VLQNRGSCKSLYLGRFSRCVNLIADQSGFPENFTTLAHFSVSSVLSEVRGRHGSGGPALSLLSGKLERHCRRQKSNWLPENGFC
jgi:hypothetical protein